MKTFIVKLQNIFNFFCKIFHLINNEFFILYKICPNFINVHLHMCLCD